MDPDDRNTIVSTTYQYMVSRLDSVDRRLTISLAILTASVSTVLYQASENTNDTGAFEEVSLYGWVSLFAASVAFGFILATQLFKLYEGDDWVSSIFKNPDKHIDVDAVNTQGLLDNMRLMSKILKKKIRYANTAIVTSIISGLFALFQ